jgi:hypothetical protein
MESPFWEISLLCIVSTLSSFSLGFLLGYFAGKEKYRSRGRMSPANGAAVRPRRGNCADPTDSTIVPCLVDRIE